MRGDYSGPGKDITFTVVVDEVGYEKEGGRREREGGRGERGRDGGTERKFPCVFIVWQGFAAVYEWDFGDGLRVKTSEHATTETQTHAYTEHGVYTVRVTVFNPAGSSSTSLVVHVGGESHITHSLTSL